MAISDFAKEYPDVLNPYNDSIDSVIRSRCWHAVCQHPLFFCQVSYRVKAETLTPAIQDANSVLWRFDEMEAIGYFIFRT